MLFWLVLISVIGVLGYFSLRTEPNQSGGDFMTFVRHSDDSGSADGSQSSRKRSKRKDETKDVWTTPGRQVLILYGTAYGFAEQLGKKLYMRIKEEVEPSLNIQPRLVNMKDAEVMLELEKETTMFVICSTAGDGVPPSDARDFFDWLSANKLDLSGCHSYACMALGDTAYPHFCRAGKTLDKRFLELGVQALTPRIDVDREDWPVIDGWMSTLISSFSSGGYHTHPETVDYLSPKIAELESSASGWSRTNPFMARISSKYLLTQLGRPDDKEIIHLDIDLTGSELEYTSGDALGIMPTNDVNEVKQVLKYWGKTGRERVFYPREAPLQDLLLHDYDLKAIKTSFLQCLLQDCHPSPIEAEALRNILAAGDSKNNSLLVEYTKEREIRDVLREHPKASKNLTIRNALVHLRPLQPRYYSISSAPMNSMMAESGGLKASVTAGVIRYETLNIARGGVCTTFLADRVDTGASVPVFISSNKDFRLPKDNTRDIIMVGPGTGVAPFRAFIQERVTNGAQGTNTLYFGCRHKDRDYTYREELESWQNQGQLILRTAFSRDSAKKVYVQHLIEEDGATIASQLLHGAHFYICGDGSAMALDVEAALARVLQKHMPQEAGIHSEQEAKEYIKKMAEEGRFEKDVWIT